MPDPNKQNNVLITGASGLIGTALGAALRADGYEVYSLLRDQSDAPFTINQEKGEIRLDDSIPLKAVINLAGANIADGRWTRKRKQIIRDSRIKTTTLLCDALARLSHKPEVLLSASAIGYYGNSRQQSADEFADAGDDFLAELAVAWETASMSATAAGIRTVFLRFGLVLSNRGGVLDNLVMPLRLAVVGRLGDGNHLQSWISLEDVVATVRQILNNPGFAGPLNVVAPEVVSNKDFASTLGKVLRRPQLPPLPAPVVRLMFGEMADAALLASSNVRSSRYEELGIAPVHQTLLEALQAEFH